VSRSRGRRWIRPSWFAILLACAGVTFFSTLGVWQLHRAVEKEALLAAYAGAARQAPVTLGAARQKGADAVYPHVRVRGRFDPQHSYLLDDQIRGGRQGVIVYNVFDPEDGALPLLVNRGFLDKDERAKTPGLLAVATGDIELTGLYAPAPGTGLRLGGNALVKQDSWPKLTIYIDTADIAEDLGSKLDSRVLLLDADPESGFLREWTPQVLSPERHRGYAFQWFCFVAATLVIFVVLHWRRVKTGSE
jgi:surfeit locus 1 family protein